MAGFRKFEEIVTWQEARKLNIEIGKLIDEGQFQTNFRIINQIESSAGSIMDNIAEGYERNDNKEFLHFLFIAKGSCGELRSQMYRALDRGYINIEQFDALTKKTEQVSYLIHRLIHYLQQSSYKGIKSNTKEIPEIKLNT